MTDSKAPSAVTPPGSAPLGTIPASQFPFLHLRNVIAILAFAALLYALWMGRTTILLFLMAAMLGILIAPVAGWLTAKGLRRGWASLLSVLLFLGVVGGIAAFSGKAIARQAETLYETFQDPQQLRSAADALERSLAKLPTAAQPSVNGNAISADYLIEEYLPNQLVPAVMEWLQTHLSFGTVLGGLGALFAALFVVPFLMFWMVKDSPKFRTTFLTFLPAEYQPPVGEFLDTWVRTLRSYFRGVLLSMLFVFAMDCILLSSLTDIESWLLLALIGAVLELLPMIGGWIATIIAIAVGLIEGGPDTVVRVMLIKMFVQVMENQVVIPRVMGKQLDIHPLTVLFFLLIGGSVAGPAGAILSLPVAATLKILLDEYHDGVVRRILLLARGGKSELVVADGTPVSATVTEPEAEAPAASPFDPLTLPPEMRQRPS